MPAVESAQGLVTVKHVVVSVVTRAHVEMIDITPSVAQIVTALGLRDGVVTVYTRHTTTGLIINEHEPLLLGDLQAMFERLVPCADPFDHDDMERRTVNLTPGERPNGAAHCRAAMLRTSETIPVADGRLDLGRWQRVFLVEFDGCRRREIAVVMMGMFRAGPYPLGAES
jgi:secondary thiamine-phosphate synthase enzyme